jgi:hypothetical protein
VKFNTTTAATLIVNGLLSARGTELAPIIFTSGKPTSPGTLDFSGIQFASSATPAVYDENGTYASGSILEFCQFSYGSLTTGS